jgi:prevent-host-death family protein
MQMGLREANQRFSYLMKRVKSGETVLITERGKAVAVVMPIGNTADKWESALDRLDEAGLIIRATKSGPMRPFKRIHIEGESLSETLSRERDER